MIKIFLPFLIYFILIPSYQSWSQIPLHEIIRRNIENFQINRKIGEENINFPDLLASFYLPRTFEPVWDNPKRVEQLIEVLQNAGKEGLNPKDYHLLKISRFQNNIQELTIEQKAHFDLLLSDAMLLYASHLLNGKVKRSQIDPNWQISNQEEYPVEVLERAAAGKNITAIIQNLLPKHQTYIDLKKALHKYEHYREEDGGWPKLSEGTTLKKGMEDERIALIRERLSITGDLESTGPSPEHLFDGELHEAVIKFQKRHNLEPDGIIGKGTLSAMNVPVEDRINQIKINLERWRWLPKKFSDYYIKVNIADFTLTVNKNGIKEREHNIIVGRLDRKTPVFSSKMSYLVLNPTWTIPPGILQKDIIPAVKNNAGYLKTKNIRVFNTQGKEINPAATDWDSPVIKNYSYIQAPGPTNALGGVKFMFPNNFYVYLHDTPAQALFSSNERAFSSGCIRVHQSLDLAEYLLNDPDKWGMENIKKVINTRVTQTVTLKEKPDIHILYLTAWTGKEGKVQFRRDVYQRDEAISKALTQ